MCFSATASFVAGGALTATGVLALTQAQEKKELPFAAIPLLFGVQQAVEGFVWISFGSAFWNTAMTYAYAMFSHILWPMFVPVAVLTLEIDPLRIKILRLFAVIGAGVGLYLLYFIITDPVTAQIVDNSIAYRSPHLYPLPTMFLYLIATCGSCLASSHRIIRIFGVVLFVSFGIAAWVYANTFFSVWCFFAALLSVLILWYFKARRRNV